MNGFPLISYEYLQGIQTWITIERGESEKISIAWTPEQRSVIAMGSIFNVNSLQFRSSSYLNATSNRIQILPKYRRENLFFLNKRKFYKVTIPMPN